MIIAFSLALAAASTAGAPSHHAARAAAPKAEISQCRNWIEGRSATQHDLEGQLQVISPQVACFDGGITKNSIKPVEEWLGRARPGDSTPTFVVYSGGGDAEAGIELAEKLDATDASVLVDGICASACADYLFSGVLKRSVTDGSMILFHGGIGAKAEAAMTKIFDKMQQMNLIKPADLVTKEKQVTEQVDALRRRQDDLYRKSGVDPAVVYGFDQLDMKSIADADCDPTRDGPHDFLVFSASQMARLGLTVESGTPETDPRKINRAIVSLGKQHEICRAPNSFFKSAASKAASSTQQGGAHPTG